GKLILDGLTFDNTNGMQITFTNNMGGAVAAADTADVLVLDADGVQVYSAKNQTVLSASVADGTQGVATFANYKQMGSESGVYKVTMTFHTASGDYTATATLRNA